MFTLLFLSQPSDLFLFACKRSGSRHYIYVDLHRLFYVFYFFPFNWFSNFIIQCSWGHFSQQTPLRISSLVFFCASTGFVAQTLAVCLIMLETFTHCAYFQTLYRYHYYYYCYHCYHKRVSLLQEVQAFSCINLFLILLIVIIFLILSEIYRKTS